MKIPSSEHGENMLYTEIDFDIQNNLCTQHVFPYSAKIRASDKDLPVEMTTETNGNGIHITNGIEITNGKHYGLNGNHGEYPNVTVVNSRSVNYLLTKLRNKDTEAKVCTKTLTLKTRTM